MQIQNPSSSYVTTRLSVSLPAYDNSLLLYISSGGYADMAVYFHSSNNEVSDNIEISKLYKLMQNILSPDEYLIICRRYGLFSQRRYTQQEIADSLGISRSYVSRIEKRCLQKLKEAFL